VVVGELVKSVRVGGFCAWVVILEHIGAVMNLTVLKRNGMIVACESKWCDCNIDAAFLSLIVLGFCWNRALPSVGMMGWETTTSRGISTC
jgi:hypothetical protein